MRVIQTAIIGRWRSSEQKYRQRHGELGAKNPKTSN